MTSPAPTSTPSSIIISQPLLNAIPEDLLPRFDPIYVEYYNTYNAGRLATHQIPISTYRANPDKYTIAFGRQRIQDCFRITEQQCPVTPQSPSAPAAPDSPAKSSITVRIFEPAPDAHGKTKEGKRAAYINFHGGGWVFGGLPTDEDFCKRLTWELGVVCFDVDYRLAPEFKFPTPVNDCWDAFRWVSQSVFLHLVFVRYYETWKSTFLDPMKICSQRCVTLAD